MLPRSYLSPQQREGWKAILEMMNGKTRKAGKETISVSMETKKTLLGPSQWEEERGLERPVAML